MVQRPTATARRTSPLYHDIACTRLQYNVPRTVKTGFVDKCLLPKPSGPSHSVVGSLSLLTAPHRPQFRSVFRVATEQMSAQTTTESNNPTKLCTSLTATTVQGMLAEAQEAQRAGADIVELRIDYLESFSPEADLPVLIQKCGLPAIVTYRPTWEGGKYGGGEAPRLATLKYATELGAAYVDIELKIAPVFQVALRQNPPKGSPKTKIIVSTHNYECTPSDEVLDDLFRKCKTVGADIVKIATTATSILDATRLLKLMNQRWTSQGAVIALAMGEAGQITRVLAGKYGGFLTFGALSPDRASAPGQPTLTALRNVYRLQDQRAESKVYGIIGNPVSHSKSPAIHNAAFRELGLGTDAVYVPLLVDSFQPFLQTIENDSCFRDWQGFSVTIPHKEAALAGATGGADAVTRKIGAANTLIRVDSASTSMFKAYNTDWSAAIGAIERALGGSLKGLAVVVLGAGGAGRALAFGAAAAGADRVVIANRSEQRAHQVAASVGEEAQGTSLEAVASGQVSGDILINTTSVGMAGKSVDKSPLDSTDIISILGRYKLVFDAVYTPLHTKLLQDAQAAGCKVVTGDAMFVGQAADQFLLFTGQRAPIELMRRIVLGGEEE